MEKEFKNTVKTAMKDAGMLFINLQKTSVSENDYIISCASFLVLKGQYQVALDIFERMNDLSEEDTSFLSYMRGVCLFYLDREYEAKEMFEQSYKDKYNSVAGYRYGKLLLGSESTEDQIKGISLIRRTAFMYNLDAMKTIADLCHNDAIAVETQDRKQELFWRNAIVVLIKRCASIVRNHAFNKAEGSYDMRFEKAEIDADFALAKALGAK